MSKRYKLRIPDGCKVESVCRSEINGKDSVIVFLVPEFIPKPGDYVVTDDGQVGIKTKDGYFRFRGGEDFPFTKYANDSQKKIFNRLVREDGLIYDRYSEDVIPLPKVGDLCIFWDKNAQKGALLRFLKEDGGTWYKDVCNFSWDYCIKFINKEQFQNLTTSK